MGTAEAVSTGTGPLAGIKVLDLTTIMSGPLATRTLADLGATVIKVESTEGDMVRNSMPLREGRSAYFGALNCGKLGVTLDLKSAAGADVARRLAAECDVLVENFRPGVMTRLGLGFDELCRENEKLIYCSISGFGQTGAEAQRPAYAQVIHAGSGFDAAQQVYMDLDRPPATAIFTADVLSGLYAATAIQAALLERGRSGLGQHIDVTLFESMLNLLIYEVQEAQFPQEKTRHVYRPLKARDGHIMIPVVTQANFVALAKAMGQPRWISDPRFAHQPERVANWPALMAEMQNWVGARSVEEAEAALMKAGVACSRYRSPREALAYAQQMNRGTFSEAHDKSGPFLVPNLPFRMSRSGTAARPRVPDRGEHTAAVLRELLGTDDAAVELLRAQGAFGAYGSTTQEVPS